MNTIVDGLLLNYEQTGTGPDLVILHGWGRSVGEWRLTAERYAGRYRVTLLDLPGFGASEVPHRELTIHDYAEITATFLGKVGIKECILLGHSLGGRIGTILAATQPEIIEKLLLVDSAGVERKSPSVRIKRAIVTMAKMLGLHHVLPRGFRDFFSSSDYRSALPAMKKTFANIVHEDLTRFFPQVACPTLVVWGSHDRVLPVTYTKVYARLVKDCTVRIVYEAGHDPHIDDPAQFFAITDEFLLSSYS